MAEYSSRLPRDLYQAAAVQQLDRLAIDTFGIEGFGLMQRAGRACFAALLEHWPETRRLRVFAGAGNNAGDGYVIAALAAEQGLQSEIVYLSSPDRLRGDAAKAYAMARKEDVQLVAFNDYYQQPEGDSPTVLVDALLGTGLDREVTGDYAAAISLINASHKPVLAVDIPSGLHANTGEPLGCAVDAGITVTFIGMKQGLLTGSAPDYIGKLFFSDLGVPSEVYLHADAAKPGVKRIDINSVRDSIKPRAPASHKGAFGHVVVVGGDRGYGGAVLMAAEAAQRSGAGLVSVITRSEHRAGMLARRPELMVAGTEDEGFDAAELLAKATVIVVGPGLGRGRWGEDLLGRSLATQMAQQTPLVIDADGLNLLADRDNGQTGLKRETWILTPHPGEAARLLDTSLDMVKADRFAAIAAMQQKWGGTCLLKGSGSLIRSSFATDTTFLCDEGNAGMASGGMGDVLAGVTAALVAQGLPNDQALQCAVCVHGEAADLAAAESGQRGMLATDLLPLIRQLLNPDL
jgi:hydroxyethylthiazole kinase-like uncharacterized protein yjeF